MSDSDLIVSNSPFSENDRSALRIIVRMIIPSDADLGVPGADDNAILSVILTKGIQFESVLSSGIRALTQLSEEHHDVSFTDLPEARQVDLVEDFKPSRADFFSVLTSITIQAYYQDKRVLESLDIEPRPPFPLGYEVEQGDWSLLDPVRRRSKLYREV